VDIWLLFSGFIDHTHTVGLFWTSDQPVAETQGNTRDKHLCPQRDSNPRPQQPSGRRPTLLLYCFLEIDLRCWFYNFIFSCFLSKGFCFRRVWLDLCFTSVSVILAHTFRAFWCIWMWVEREGFGPALCSYSCHAPRAFPISGLGIVLWSRQTQMFPCILQTQRIIENLEMLFLPRLHCLWDPVIRLPNRYAKIISSWVRTDWAWGWPLTSICRAWREFPLIFTPQGLLLSRWNKQAVFVNVLPSPLVTQKSAGHKTLQCNASRGWKLQEIVIFSRYFMQVLESSTGWTLKRVTTSVVLLTWNVCARIPET
jgi:hypothetical protein